MAGSANAGVATLDIGTTGGPGFSLSTTSVISFDNLAVVDSTNSADILDSVVEIGNLTVDVGSRTPITVGSLNIVTYSFLNGGTTTFRIFDPTGAVQWLEGTLKVNQLVILNGSAINIDADFENNDLTAMFTLNGANAQTLVDLVANAQASFTMAFTINPRKNFDTLLTTNAGITGPVAASISSSVPEPASMALLAIGLSAMFSRRKR